MYFLGIDTSCYTTSLAIADVQGNILLDRRSMLRVQKHARGLRQSEMVFQHIKNLLELFPQGYQGIGAVAASTVPRPAEGSYMPVFRVAESFGKAAAYAAGAAFYALSHQHAHIGAAIIGTEKIFDGEFLALHVSGGTTDVLKVRAKHNLICSITTIGQASDITAGQLIDRIGVTLGYDFPAGAAISVLGSRGVPEHMNFSIRGLNASFSGAESAVRRRLKQGMSAEDAAATVLLYVAKVLNKLITRACEQTGIMQVLLFGGVMRSEWIRAYLGKEQRAKLVFAEPKYASDNACGLAIQAGLYHQYQGVEDEGKDY